MTRAAYLPVTREVRDRANEHLRRMAARGFGCTVDEALRVAKLCEEALK